MTALRPRLYVAHPIVTYGTARERHCLDALRSILPDVELYDPAGRYSTNAAWRRAWPRVLKTLSGLVVFTSHDGTIGAGCMRELIDALVRNLPIAGLEEGMLHEIDAVRFLAPRRLTACRTGRLVLGDQIDPGEFVARAALGSRSSTRAAQRQSAPWLARTALRIGGQTVSPNRLPGAPHTPDPYLSPDIT